MAIYISFCMPLTAACTLDALRQITAYLGISAKATLTVNFNKENRVVVSYTLVDLILLIAIN